jgi:hypothetical protein
VTLSSLQYTVNGGNIKNNVTPGVFFYWVAVTVPAASNSFTITQTITVTFSNNTFQAYLQVVELCGNDTSAPIAQQMYTRSGADGTQSTPYTANLPAAPLAGTNFDVYFLNVNEDLGGGIPTSSPVCTNLTFGHTADGSAQTSFKGTPSQNEQFTQNPTPTAHHWGTIAVEIKRP